MNDICIRKRETKKGFTYEYRFEVASVGGKRRFVTKSGFSTKAEAKEAGRKAQIEYEQHGKVQKNDDLSVADLMSKWLDNANLKDTTRTGYEKKIRNYINPVIGSYRAVSMDYETIQGIINNLYDKGFSLNTISSVAGILSKAFRYAFNIYKIPMPFAELTIPKNKRKEVETRKEPHIYIPKEQFQAILQRFPESTSAYIPLLLGYSCGMRLGEVFALTWDDIDLDNRTININKQVQWEQKAKAGTVGRGGVKRNDTDYGFWYFTNPKYDSKRIIDILDDNIVDVLRREKERQEKARTYYKSIGNCVYTTDGKLVGKTYTEYYENYIEENYRPITNEPTDKPLRFVMVREDGSYITQRIMMHTTSVIKKQIGIAEFDFHSLRHTHTTDLCNLIDEQGNDENKIKPVYVQKRLGHKDITTTMNIYYHLTEERRKREAAKLKNIYSDLF